MSPGRASRARSVLGAFTSSLIVAGLAGSASSGVVACKRAAPRPSISSARPPDLNADGKRLASAASAWPDRWREVGALPDCTPLLNATDRESCESTVASVSALRAALARQASSQELIELAAATALRAQRATQRLRAAGIDKLFEQRPSRKPDAKTAGASAPYPKASSSALGASAPYPRASSSALGASAPVRKQDEPTLTAIAAYARVAALGLRELGMYLEFGPLDLRGAAFRELTKLSEQEPQWSALKALVAEASLVEVDRELKQRLLALREHLGPA